MSGAGAATGKADPRRRSQQSTLVEFIHSARSIFPGVVVDGHARDAAIALIAGRTPERDVCVSDDRSEIVCALFGGAAKPAFAVALQFGAPCGDHALSLARVFTRVFNTDVAAAPRAHRDGELWTSLGHTRLMRVIARLATFRTDFFFRCLRTMEGARETTYERSAFATRLLVTNQVSHVADAAGPRFHRLRTLIPLDTALTAEKWVRAFTRQGSIALVATPRRSTVAGVIVLPQDAPPATGGLHPSLAHVEGLVTNGVALIAATANGDVWVRLANGMKFLRRRSRWQHVDLDTLSDLLLPVASIELARVIARMALDASFERRGALFGVLASATDLPLLVPDTNLKRRYNRGLRDLVAGLDVTNPDHLALVRDASTIDGAVLLGGDGRVLDAACMAVDLSVGRRDELGLSAWSSLPGARSTAARSISGYGASVKVSEDGPISVYVGGVLRLEIG